MTDPRATRVLFGEIVGPHGRFMEVRVADAEPHLQTHYIGIKENHVPVDSRDPGGKVVLRYVSNRISGFWHVEPFFPDTADGALAAIKYLAVARLVEEYRDAKMTADPSAEGVWAADLPDGRRVIVYLAGYPETRGGALRRMSDFEEGTR